MNSDGKTRAQRLGNWLRWLVVTLACMWIAWCTSIGPLIRAGKGTRDFSWTNALLFAASFAACLGIVLLVVRAAQRHDSERRIVLTPHTTLYRISRWIVDGTSTWQRIWLILAIGWLWVPASLLSAFGADIYSQTREFAWAWNQWTGMEQPYIGFFSFVPMDIYPTAHYMWPDAPTYLTDQHNIVLTFLYGGAAELSRYLTGSNDLAFVLLSLAQWLFAGFCCASAANRFINLPWLAATANSSIDFAHPERRARNTQARPVDFTHPERGFTTILPEQPSSNGFDLPRQSCGPIARLLVMLFFLLCPLVLFSTISLTKSPLFAFAFTWWFGVMYELYMTMRKPQQSPRPVTIAALAVSSSIMLISAKYAWYILLAVGILVIIADRKRWPVYTCAILLPTILIHGAISMMIARGTIIGGDPIESRGVQLQMIARVAKENPQAISSEARELLAPIFNLDQTAAAYRAQDADPVKSSGIQSKKVSYKWRTVTPEDMDNFNKAWLDIVRADPHTALDALFAKSYGYFDIFDPAYVPMSYYINNDYVQNTSTWIKYYAHGWRDSIVKFTQRWSRIPVLGCFTHGNCYVVLTLLLGCCELALRRWRALSWHMSLLLLMGVMITAPANNFERHMLPIAFVFAFLVIMFHRDTQHQYSSR